MSAGGQKESVRIKSLRPWFLVAAMVVTWLAGVHGVTTGCGTVVFLREGRIPDDTFAIEDAKAAPDPNAAIFQLAASAELRATAEFSKTMLPISVAQVLLSMLLVAASAMVLSGRPGARSFALQTLAANAAFAVIAYVAKQEMRTHWVNATVAAARAIDTPQNLGLDASSFWFWFARSKLIVYESCVIGLATLAILAKRTGIFFAASARAEERREREDEP